VKHVLAKQYKEPAELLLRAGKRDFDAKSMMMKMREAVVEREAKQVVLFFFFLLGVI
jgi:hypothetical protein